jgi:site-specific recombinase
MEPKQEIAQIIDMLPDEVLNELVQYLRQVEKASQEKARMSLHLKTIFLEDKELLERLAK